MVANIREQIKPYTPPPVPTITVLPAPKPARKPKRRTTGERAIRDLREVGMLMELYGIGTSDMPIVERVQLVCTQRNQWREFAFQARRDLGIVRRLLAWVSRVKQVKGE